MAAPAAAAAAAAAATSPCVADGSTTAERLLSLFRGRCNGDGGDDGRQQWRYLTRASLRGDATAERLLSMQRDRWPSSCRSQATSGSKWAAVAHRRLDATLSWQQAFAPAMPGVAMVAVASEMVHALKVVRTGQR